MSDTKKHSKLGASIAKRWLNCPGSVAACETAPPQRESEYAAEGTLAHSWLEFVLNTELLGMPDKLLGRPKGVSLEMENHVQTAVNWIQENFMESLGDMLLVESEVDLSHVDPSMFGTNDVAIIRPFGVLTVVDYKHGAGIPVDVVDDKGNPNEQLMYYALGISKKFDHNFSEVELVIIQPRAPHADGPIRSHKVSIDELLKFEGLLRKGAERTKKKDARRFAGEWCQFCAAKLDCSAFKDKANAAAQAAFSDEIDVTSETLPALPEAKELSPDVIGRILQNADALEAWIDAVRKHAKDILQRGGKVDGFKLVNKRATRVWVNPESISSVLLRDEMFDVFELKTPKQVETILKNDTYYSDFVKNNTASVSSGVTIAPESDRRPSVDHIKNVFDDEGEKREEEKVEEKDVEEKVAVQEKASRKKGGRKKKSETEEIDLGF